MIALNDRTRLTGSLGTFIFAYTDFNEKEYMEDFVTVTGVVEYITYQNT